MHSDLVGLIGAERQRATELGSVTRLEGADGYIDDFMGSRAALPGEEVCEEGLVAGFVLDTIGQDESDGRSTGIDENFAQGARTELVAPLEVIQDDDDGANLAKGGDGPSQRAKAEAASLAGLGLIGVGLARSSRGRR